MKKSKIIMLLAALLPLGLFIFPLWNITLEAPQYPIPLGMNIHINDFSDAHPYDIKNINLMNHYVGMKYIPDAIPEFKIFPIGILITTFIGLVIGFKFNYKWFLAWFILMVVISSAGLYDFYLWNHDYGHNLDPKAILKFTNADGTVMGFQPPLFGSKDILNFKVHSYPRLGALFLGLGIGLSLFSYFIGKKETVLLVLLRNTHFLNTKSMKRAKPFRERLVFLKISAMNKALKKITALVVLTLLLGCNVDPKPIEYGQDSCHYCKMTIVDKLYAAEIITKKGKIYTFDATECMINFLSEFDASTVKLYLSNNYSNPGELIDATQATFLISENISSPMGAFLSAFKYKEDAAKKEGDIYTWNDLLNHLEKSKINQNFN